MCRTAALRLDWSAFDPLPPSTGAHGPLYDAYLATVQQAVLPVTTTRGTTAAATPPRSLLEAAQQQVWQSLAHIPTVYPQHNHALHTLSCSLPALPAADSPRHSGMKAADLPRHSGMEAADSPRHSGVEAADSLRHSATAATAGLSASARSRPAATSLASQVKPTAAVAGQDKPTAAVHVAPSDPAAANLASQGMPATAAHASQAAEGASALSDHQAAAAMSAAAMSSAAASALDVIPGVTPGPSLSTAAAAAVVQALPGAAGVAGTEGLDVIPGVTPGPSAAVQILAGTSTEGGSGTEALTGTGAPAEAAALSGTVELAGTEALAGTDEQLLQLTVTAEQAGQQRPLQGRGAFFTGLGHLGAAINPLLDAGAATSAVASPRNSLPSVRTLFFPFFLYTTRFIEFLIPGILYSPRSCRFRDRSEPMEACRLQQSSHDRCMHKVVTLLARCSA